MSYLDVKALLNERAREHSTWIKAVLLFGEAWANAATHEQRVHRLAHVYLGDPWTYEDGPSGFSVEHPFGFKDSPTPYPRATLSPPRSSP